MSLEAIKYSDRSLKVLDQVLLPGKTEYVDVITIEDGFQAIKTMKVRGAPAIAVVGALTLAVDMSPRTFDNADLLLKYVTESLDYLVSARPTAVNIARAAIELKEYLSKMLSEGVDVVTAKEKLIKHIEDMLVEDVDANMKIGDQGAYYIINQLRGSTNANVLTHCNAGALATVGYGTAVGVIRSLQKHNRLDHVFCTETRPYNQGARLTAYELVHEGINSTLITDSAVSIAMSKRAITNVVVGADRVALNGDTANKIGTYQLAISAKYHGIPFYVAAPTTTIDPLIKTGKDIPIEERSNTEITHFRGEQVAAKGIGCWNPAFDVTPADLITGGIITEKGVFQPGELREKLFPSA